MQFTFLAHPVNFLQHKMSCVHFRTVDVSVKLELSGSEQQLAGTGDDTETQVCYLLPVSDFVMI